MYILHSESVKYVKMCLLRPSLDEIAKIIEMLNKWRNSPILVENDT